MRIFYVIGIRGTGSALHQKVHGSRSYEEKAYEEAIKLVSLNPSSDLGLRYAINSSGLLVENTMNSRNIQRKGINYYPEEPFYQAKRATVLERDKRYEASLEFLKPILNKYPSNKEIIGAFSQKRISCLQLTKAKEPEKLSFIVLDTALLYDSQNKSLKYTKGVGI